MNSTINFCKISRFKKHPVLLTYLAIFDESTLKKLRCPYKKGFYFIKEQAMLETVKTSDYGVFITSLFRIRLDLERIFLNTTCYTVSNQLPIMIVNTVETWSGKIET
jgi:hypothetical protein